MRRRSTFFLLVLYTLTFVAALPSAHGQTSVETELFDLINGGRENKLTLHTGLRGVAREHAEEMSADGELNHNGAERRIAEARPDPHEQNGAPDDGFNGTWCENVAYVRGAPQNEVARRMYDAWTASSSHNRCMNNEGINAAGIGLYFDGDETYWATYESAVDRTLPGSEAEVTASPSPTSTPTPTAAPIIPTLRTEPPEPTEPPTPTPQTAASATPSEEPTTSPAESAAAPAVSVQTGSRVSTSGLALAPALPSAKRTGVGWPELAATMGVIGLAGEFLRRLTRMSAASETSEARSKRWGLGGRSAPD